MTNWPYLFSFSTTNVVKAEDEYLYLENGTRMLDAAGGAIVANIGHGRAEVADVVADSIRRTGYVVPPWQTPERLRLLDRLTRYWLPPQLNCVHFTCSGSEGIECAVKMAIQYHAAKGNRDKYKVLKREISYHGTTIAATAIGGHEPRKRGIEHILDPYPIVPTPHALRCPSSDPLDYFVAAFQAVLERENPDTISAFVFEPITGASGGAIVPPDGYLEKIQEICQHHDILLICDEVMTGFGRTGTRFGFQHWNFIPDIIVGGKGLTGGYAALTAVATTEDVRNTIKAGGFEVMFHTFASLPSACAAADKVLEIMDREDLVAKARSMGAQLEIRLRNAFSNHPHVAETRGRGLLQAVEFVQDRKMLTNYPEEKKIASKIVNRLMKKGVFTYKGGNGIVQDVVVLGPPLTISENQLDELVGKLAEVVDEVTLN